jgi:acyl carrier protein
MSILMQNQEAYAIFEEVLEVPSGTLNGRETLDSLERWDSMAVLGLIALADERFGVALSSKRLLSCVTVDDVALLLRPQGQ